MTSGYMLKIYYRDGHTEEHYCDYYEKENGLLIYYILSYVIVQSVVMPNNLNVISI